MNLKLFVCENYLEEVSATFHRVANRDIELCSYTCLCDNRQKKEASLRQLRALCDSDSRIVILSSEKCRLKDELGDLPQVSIKQHAACYFCSASDWMLQYMKDHGGFVIGRAWLNSWEQHLSDAGFDKVSARMHYRQYYQEIICLGSRQDALLVASLHSLSTFLDLPSRVLELDQEYLDLMIHSTMHELRMAEDASKDLPADLICRGVLSSANLGLMTDLMSCETVDQIVTTTTSLCLDLFGASNVELAHIPAFMADIPLVPPIPSDGQDNEMCFDLSVNSKAYGRLRISDFSFPKNMPSYKPVAEKLAEFIARCLHNLSAFDDYRMQISTAKEESLQKNTFLARMAHELRTPLHGVMGTLQLLELTPLSEEQKKYIQMSLHSSQVLLHTINDILTYSRMDANKLELSISQFSIRELFLTLHDLFFTETLSKNIDLVFFTSGSFPEHIEGDMGKLREILVNLVGNAFKFTETGHIAVTANWDGNVQEGNTIVISFTVSDTGLGIPQENLEDIFKYFYQVDSSNTRKMSGSGLGLSISKGLVELMGGSIQVESEPGKGSVFTFDIRISIAV